MWLIGAAKRDCTYFEPGIGLLGWGKSSHKAYAIESRLYARVFYLEKEGNFLFWGELDIAFITPALREEIFHRLRRHIGTSLHPANLILTANHTHSAPGGYSYELLYNLNTPGFHRKVFETLVEATVEAALAARAAAVPSYLFFGKTQAPRDMPIAFNRSWAAYRRDPLASPEGKNDPACAVDRTFSVLHTQPQGHLLSWFGSHTTTIQADNLCISSDHKGWASEAYEAKYPGSVAAFAQTTAGDVTPNFFSFDDLPVKRGPTPDPYRNRYEVGRYQLQLAESLIHHSLTTLQGPLRSILLYLDMRNQKANPAYAWGHGNAHTGSPAIGIPFFTGTQEGPGIPAWMAQILSLFAARQPQTHGPKKIILESFPPKILGRRAVHLLPLPPWDDVVKLVKYFSQEKKLYMPLTPFYLPIHLVQIGHIGIVGLPFEPTTLVGTHIRHYLAGMWQGLGVQEVIVQGYTNAYAGYLTTYHEYQMQLYEGGSTHFGMWSLSVVLTVLERMGMALMRGETLSFEVPYVPLEERLPHLLTYEVARAVLMV
ncbi:MAG: neutral/alkaline non-lysosomal ceramidase N-terminal domain-containing protein [Bacteroidia bacterium]